MKKGFHIFSVFILFLVFASITSYDIFFLFEKEDFKLSQIELLERNSDANEEEDNNETKTFDDYILWVNNSLDKLNCYIVNYYKNNLSNYSFEFISSLIKPPLS